MDGEALSVFTALFLRAATPTRSTAAIRSAQLPCALGVADITLSVGDLRAGIHVRFVDDRYWETVSTTRSQHQEAYRQQLACLHRFPRKRKTKNTGAIVLPRPSIVVFQVSLGCKASIRDGVLPRKPAGTPGRDRPQSFTLGGLGGWRQEAGIRQQWLRDDCSRRGNLCLWVAGRFQLAPTNSGWPMR